MREIKKTMFIYGDRGWNERDQGYSEASINRGFGALSAYLEELQEANNDLVVHSVSASMLDLIDGNKRLYLSVLYSGEIQDVLTGVLGRYGFEAEDESYNINEHLVHGYNKLMLTQWGCPIFG